MNIYIVIPAHNEEAHIEQTLTSLANQTLLPKKIVVVDDHSTDRTPRIISKFCEIYPFITTVSTDSKKAHQPGAKIIDAFYYGFKTLDSNYDIICKFDADLIFPSNYLEEITNMFNSDPNIGMVGGFCYIEKDSIWTLENLTNKDHIRGALKAYKKECFEAIGGLKRSMGWDTVDELLAQYHGWKIQTNESLQVKHLKPTGKIYKKEAGLKQGEAFYKLRYGKTISQIAAIKLAQKKGSFRFYFDCMRGYLKSQKAELPFLVSEEEGIFIRKLRWKNIKNKLF